MKRILLLLFIFFTNFIHAQLAVNNTSITPAQLVQSVLLGTGVTASNITFNGSAANANLVRDQAGQFSNGSTTNIGIDGGIILGTGKVSFAPGPSNSPTNTDPTSQPIEGDNDLFILSGKTIRNKSVLEFDFVPMGENLNFNFVFASEEYPTYANTNFNDVFGFFLSGPGITGPYSNNAKNIALIPGTTTPITINDLNNGNTNNGPCEYCNFYVNNTASGQNPTTGITTIKYNGFTTVLAAISNIQCGQTYHIKLAIANAGDNSLDSAVFLQGGSFSVTPIAFPQDYLISNGFAPCFGSTTQICTGLGATVPHVWTLDNVVIPNATGPCIDATVAGVYCATAYPYGPNCPVSDCVTLEILPPLPINPPNDLTSCSNIFNLTLNTPVVLNGFTGDVTYFTSMQNAEDLASPIGNTTAFVGTEGQIIYIRVDDSSGSNCYEIQSFVLHVGAGTITAQQVPDLVQCDDNADGIGSFDFTPQTAIALGSYSAADYTVTYHTTLAAANGDTGAITNTTSYPNTSNPQTIYVRVEKNCNTSIYATTSFQLIVNPLPTATISGTTAVCQNATQPLITFTGAGGTAPYTFIYDSGSGPTQVGPSTGNVFTLPVSTTALGVFTYNLLSVQDSSSTLCSQNQTGSAVVTVNELPTATISGTSDHCINTGTPQITFTATTGTAPFTFNYTLNGAAQSVTSPTNTYTLTAPNNTAGVFTYTLVSVTDANCTQAQTGSATITINPLPTATISGTAGVCLNDANPNIIITGANGTAPYTFVYSINTVVQLPVTTTTGNSVAIPVATTTAGPFVYELVSVTDSSSTTCSQAQTGMATITVADAPTIVNPTPYVICDDNNDGQGCFNLHTKDNEITAGNAALQVLYYETLAGSQLGGTLNLITANPYCTINNLGLQTVYVRVVNPAAPTCASLTTLDLITNPRPLPNPTITEYALCDYNNPGDMVEVFDLTTKGTEIANGQTNVTITYYETQAAAIAQTPQIITPNAYQNTSNPQTIWINIADNTTLCNSVGSFLIRVNPLPLVVAPPVNNQCSNGSSNQAIFNLSVNNPIVTGAQSGVVVTYYNTLADAQNEVVPSLSPTSYLGTDGEIVFIRVENVATGCYSTSQVQLAVTQGPVAITPTPLEYCDPNNDGFGIFNLNAATNQIAGGSVPTGVSVTYHETQADAILGANAIPLTTPYANIVPNTQTIYVRVFYTLTGCANYVQLQLIVNPTPEATEPADYHVCDDNYDGIGAFDLTSQDALILGSIDPTTHTVHYYTSLGDAQAGNTAAAITNLNPFNNTVVNTQTIWAVVTTTATGCSDIVELVLVVDPKPTALQPNYNQYSLCETPVAGIGYEIFNLASQIPYILQGQTGMNVTFHENQLDANSGNAPLALQYTNIAPYVQTLWIRIENAATNCYVVSTMDIRVNPLPTPIPPTTPYILCDDDQDGVTEFDLNSLIPAINQGANYIITFYENQISAEMGDVVNQLPSPYSNTNNSSVQFIWVRAEDPITGCFTVMQIELNVNPKPIMPVVLAPLVQCDTDSNNQDGFSPFNLEQQTPIILAAQTGAASDYTVTYYTTQANAEASPTGLSPIIGTTNYINTSNPQTIWVRVQHNTTGCFQTGSFELQVNLPLALTTPTPLNVCDNDANPNDLFTTFNLTVKDAEITQNLPGYTVTYYTSAPVTGSSVVITNPTAYANTTPAIQTLGVEVTSPNGCKSYTTLNIRVLPVPVPRFDPPALAPKCDDNNPGDMVEVFDLTVNATYIMNNNPNVTLHYYPTYADASATPPTNEILVPTAASVGQNVWIAVVSNVYIDSNNRGCYALVEQPLTVNPLPTVATGVIYRVCDNDSDGLAEFVLGTQIPIVLGTTQLPADYTVTFYATQAEALSGVGTPLSQTSYFNVTPDQQTIYFRVVNNATGCVNGTGELSLVVEEAAFATQPAAPYEHCDDDANPHDGIYTIDLTQYEAEILNGQDPAVFLVSYYNSLADADAGINAIANPSAYQNTLSPDNDVIYVKVTNSSNVVVPKCYAIATIIIFIDREADPVITTPNGVTSICVDFATGQVIRDLTLTATNTVPGTYTYEWFETSDMTTVLSTASTYTVDTAETVAGPRNYVVVMTSTALGCPFTSAPFAVTQSGPASPTSPTGYTITNAFSENQTITVEIDGFGQYLFSLDDGPKQTSNIFTNVSLGPHTIYVWDELGNCDPFVINFVETIDYPHYFTPNGDGINDTWNVTGLQNYDGVKIHIFDRYGKLIKQISSKGLGWDGTYNGNMMPASDYWFTVEFMEQAQNKKEFKAHFSLKR